VDSSDGTYFVGERFIRTHNSSIITFAKTIQDILNNPNETVGILSFNRPSAKAFLAQIKREFEQNEMLKMLYPDVLYADPAKESPKWSEDEGIIVKRTSNPREATVEGWGLVDGQPIGKHWSLVVYDDVVTPASVTTPDMINKVTEAWELSLALIASGGRRRYVGTRYHYDDTYKTIIERKAAKPRIRKCLDENGKSVLIPDEELADLRQHMGVLTFASQMLLSPTTDSVSAFRTEWLRYHDGIQPPARGLNVYIVVDPAHSKRKTSDWTVMWVIGAGADGNYHVCDVIRDRLNLSERIDALFELHARWRPLNVGYERYGLQADIEAIKLKQERENYRFPISELARVSGKLTKLDRIGRLEPVFQAGRIWLPRSLHRTIYDGKTVDLIRHFVEFEYKPFPAVKNDDMLDAMSRILDDGMHVVWPKSAPDRYRRGAASPSYGPPAAPGETWMSIL